MTDERKQRKEDLQAAPFWHTPKAHAGHKLPCGCAEDPLYTPRKDVTVRDCGAGYLLDRVIMFPVWRCYDCGNLATRMF